MIRPHVVSMMHVSLATSRRRAVMCTPGYVALETAKAEEPNAFAPRLKSTRQGNYVEVRQALYVWHISE